MGLDAQVIGTLDSHQADPSLASGEAGVMPFMPKVSEAVLGQLAQITRNQKEKHEKDFQTWQDNLLKEYSKVSPVSDIYDADRDAIASERKNAIDNIAKNTIYLSPAYQVKNPAKYNEVLANSQAYLEKVQMSKDDKIFEKSVIDMMKKDSSYDNAVNQKLLEKFRQTPLGERERFVPVADPSLDVLRQAKNIKELVKGDAELTESYNPQTGLVTQQTKYAVPEDQYYSVLAPVWEQYNKAYFENLATDEEKALGFDEWNKARILSSKPNEIVDKFSTRPNEAMRQQAQTERAAMAIEGRKDVAEMNNDTRKSIAEYNASIKGNPAYSKVDEALQSVENLKNNVEVSLDNASLNFLNKSVGTSYTKAEKLNSSNIPSDLIPKIYKGGKTAFGDAYGSLFYLEDKNGNQVFTTGKPEYSIGGGKFVDKKIYDESSSKDKRVYVVPDMSHKYTPNELAKQIAISTSKGKEQWTSYEKGLGVVSAQNKPSVGAVSAEKQLQIPDVNQNLKKRYLELKQKYPSIDTSGILGDKAHQERKSDHNTKDAIDIVNFKGNEASILSDLQKDPTVSYIIFNKKKWNPSTGWVAYNGENPHTSHIHVSFKRSGSAPSSSSSSPKKVQTFKSKKGITFTVE